MGQTEIIPAAAVQGPAITALTTPLAEIKHALAVNMGAMQLNPFDFTRLTIPTGGGTRWVVQTLEGEMEAATVAGVIVVQRDARQYWRTAFGEGEKKPPDCFSRDGMTGIGDPGGDCFKCPLNVWGTKMSNTGTPTRGKACREGKQMFLLRDQIIPELLQLPPTSLKAAKNYLLKLAGSGIAYYGAITEVGLVKTKNPGGIAYSEARFRMVRKLDERELQAMLGLHNLYLDFMDHMVVEVPADPEGERA